MPWCSAGFRGWGFNYDGFFGGFFPWFLILKFFSTLLIIGIIAYAFSVLLKRTVTVSSVSGFSDVKAQSAVSYAEALKELNLRYVRGEIDEETYLRMKQNLVESANSK